MCCRRIFSCVVIEKNVWSAVFMCCVAQSPHLARALRLLSSVAQAAGDDRRRLVADIETASLYNWLHQSQMAAVSVSATDAWLSQTDMSQTGQLQYAEFLIVKAETLLLSKKVILLAFVENCIKTRCYFDA